MRRRGGTLPGAGGRDTLYAWGVWGHVPAGKPIVAARGGGALASDLWDHANRLQANDMPTACKNSHSPIDTKPAVWCYWPNNNARRIR
jgi:hypothetical protein